jgi:peptide chain release factor 2
MKEIKVNEYWLKMYKQLETAVEDFVVLFDFWKGGDATEEETKAAYETAVNAIEDAEFQEYIESTGR